MAKIYTKTGDEGTTSLVNGRRISKSDLIIESYGTIDELNTVVGIAIEEIKCVEKASDCAEIIQFLGKIQNRLFTIGGMLATDVEFWERYWNDNALQAWTEEMESCIDQLQEQLPPFKGFILPRGSKSVAYLHLARTVCRRAERSICRMLNIAFNEQKLPKPPAVTSLYKYVNRLSDFFFILTRKMLQIENITETYWESV